MRRKAVIPKVHAQQAAYIDPLDCGSLIAYCITSRRRLSASIDLSDCNRRINWYFDNDGSGLRKIDKVIALLSDFRRDFVAAQKAFNKRPKKRL
jgi:hypothetical protein